MGDQPIRIPIEKIREYQLSRLQLIETIKLCLQEIESNSSLINDILSDLIYLQKCKQININYREQFYFMHEDSIKRKINVLVETIDKNVTNATDLIWAQLAQQKIYKLFGIMSISNWDCSENERNILRDIPNASKLRLTQPQLSFENTVNEIFPFINKYTQKVGNGKYKKEGRTKGRTIGRMRGRMRGRTRGRTIGRMRGRGRTRGRGRKQN